jgi:hypothetical protein
MKKIIPLACLLLLMINYTAKADSPLTSTDFYTAYVNIDMVVEAHKTQKFSDKIGDYLSSPQNSIDKKVAVVNALGWNMDGKKDAELFRRYLGKKYGIRNKLTVSMDDFTADELLCLGYMTAMDDYFKPQDGIEIVNMAIKKNPNSYTFNIITSLVKAQNMMDKSWCDLFKLTDAVDKNSSLTMDMKKEAIKIIFDYMNLYKDSCK